MRIPPRYGPPPIVEYQGDPGAVAAPAVRQWMRLADTLTGFGPAEWAAPSRCSGWTNRDVVVHLATGTRFWIDSISAGRRGVPTTRLDTFDPVATPARIVASAGDLADDQALARYRTVTRDLVDLVHDLAGEEWGLPAEGPLGHVSISAVLRHAAWDAWVHERDILLGIGILPPVEPDEVDSALRCAAALGPALGVLLGDLGHDRRAAGVTTTDPEVGFTVRVDRVVRVTADLDPAAPPAVHGPAVAVLEGLSQRIPLALQPAARWLTSGLEKAFESIDHRQGSRPGSGS